MSDALQNERAGAAATAHGPEDAKAVSPATPDTADIQLPPDESLPDEAVVVDGAVLLDSVQTFARRFIGYPSDLDGIAHALWIAHTHLMGAWFSTPRLAVLSPEPGSGKSRVLEITSLFVPNPVLSISSTSAYIMRKIADQDNRPTILYDEIDNILGQNARGNGELLATLNAGYRKGATTGRVQKVKDDCRISHLCRRGSQRIENFT